MDNDNCMLCGHPGFVEKRRFRVAEVIRRYAENFKTDVSAYFDGDEFGLRTCCQCGLASYHPARCGDESLYAQLQNLPMYYEEMKPEYEFALDVLHRLKPDRVLEVGCGVGHFLRKINSAYDVAGSETNPVAIASLKRSGIALDSEGRQYDFIMAFQVLEHVADAKRFLAGLVDKLASGGHLLLTVPNPDATYFREVEDVLDLPPHHMTCWSMQALETIANHFPLNKVDDYHEPQRIEHYCSILAARRRLLVGDGLLGRGMMFLGGLFDSFYAPHSHRRVKEHGHTHGVVFRKD